MNKAVDSGVLFRDLELFLTETWKLVHHFLLAEIRWSHAGGYTDHVVFADFESFAKYVRACPARTSIHAFAKARPTTVGTPKSLEELLALVTDRIHGDDENGAVLVEIYDPTRTYMPWLDRPGTPHCRHWVTDCEEDLLNDEWVRSEERLLGKAVAFYVVAPHWSTGDFYTEIYIGNVPGAY